tara:strand:+ start:1870 stop:2268 length:399 start_codon:yes stop_codon:yes gene_type:complete
MVDGKRFTHKFVEWIPDELDEDVLYISLSTHTATHACMCGCGEEVVTPIDPKGWLLLYDGKTTSLYPSVGNWSLPCRSHYWLREGRVIGARIWGEEEVKRRRELDQEKPLSHLRALWGFGEEDPYPPGTEND